MTQLGRHLQPPALARLLGGPGLDAVKIIAALVMLVDHTNAILFQWQYSWAYLLGRAAFPLFAFAAAAAILRAPDDRRLYRQAGILLVFAVLSEPVSRLMRDYDIMNVLFTLGLGALLAPFYLRLATGTRLALAIAAILVSFCGGWWEFGTAGMVLPAALAAALRYQRASDMAAVLLLLLTINLRGVFFYPAYAPGMMVATAVAALCLPAMVLLFVADVARRPQRQEQGQPRRRLMPRYFLHVFYPLHMLVLGMCK